MSSERRPWWNPDTSWPGVMAMGIAWLLAYLMTPSYVPVSDLGAAVTASIVGIVVGIIWNFVAHKRGTKKIHWIDVVFSDLFPW